MFSFVLCLISEVANDTLKKKDPHDGIRRWDRMKLTMLTAWGSALIYAFYSLYVSGFRFDVFATFVGAAMGNKYIDGLVKKLEK